MNVGRIIGIGRWGVVVGVLNVAGGLLYPLPELAWAGVAVVALALLVVSAGKVVQFAGYAIPPHHRLIAAASWLLAAASLGALVFDFTYAQLTPGYDGMAQSLLLLLAGSAIIYRGIRARYAPVTDPGPDGDQETGGASEPSP
jgi:hypothetical protein